MHPFVSRKHTREESYIVPDGYISNSNAAQLSEYSLCGIAIKLRRRGCPCIRVLMKYGCLGYVMRHEDYHSAPLPNIYTQVARWVNQPAFYKKQSFFQYCYRNQSLWEEKHLPHLHRPALKTFDEFMADVDAGFYETTARMTQPLRTVLDMLAMFPERRDELLDMFHTRVAVSQKTAR